MKTTTSISIDADILDAARKTGIFNRFSGGLSGFVERRLSSAIMPKKSIEDRIKEIQERIEEDKRVLDELKLQRAEEIRKEREREEEEKNRRLKRVYEEIRQLVYMKIEQGETLDNVLAYIDELKTTNEPVADRLDRLKENLRKGLFETIIKQAKEKQAEENGRGN